MNRSSVKMRMGGGYCFRHKCVDLAKSFSKGRHTLNVTFLNAMNFCIVGIKKTLGVDQRIPFACHNAVFKYSDSN